MREHFGSATKPHAIQLKVFFSSARPSNMEALGRIGRRGVAHDFNTLLTVIRGHTISFSTACSPKSPFTAVSAEIRKTSQTAPASLTRPMLAFS